MYARGGETSVRLVRQLHSLSKKLCSIARGSQNLVVVFVDIQMLERQNRFLQAHNLFKALFNFNNDVCGIDTVRVSPALKNGSKQINYFVQIAWITEPCSGDHSVIDSCDHLRTNIRMQHL